MLRLLAAALAATAVISASAQAQDVGEKVNQLIVYGDDPCPQPEDGSITVCARKGEAERYRIPEALRESSSPQNDAWTNKVIAYETVGATGTLSCSPVGPGGALGCTQKLIDAAYAEKATSGDVRMSALIQAERERRLATIDQEAAEAQARVEALEREYEARQRAAQEGGPVRQVPPPTTQAPGQ